VKYSEQLRDPRWQRKRLEIMHRDDWRCRKCDNHQEMLTVHHHFYLAGREPWDYHESLLVTLCDSCHNAHHERRRIHVYNAKADSYYLSERILFGVLSDTDMIRAKVISALTLYPDIASLVDDETAFLCDGETWRILLNLKQPNGFESLMWGRISPYDSEMIPTYALCAERSAYWAGRQEEATNFVMQNIQFITRKEVDLCLSN
jgi:hypothetical protein